MEVGEEGDYIIIAALSPPEWRLYLGGKRREPFWWFVNCEEQNHKAVSTNHNLFEEKGETKQNRTKAFLPTSLWRLTARPNQLTNAPEMEKLVLKTALFRVWAKLWFVMKSEYLNRQKGMWDTEVQGFRMLWILEREVELEFETFIFKGL